MSDSLRTAIQLAANILGAGFVIIMAFSQLADYFSDRHTRHLFAFAAWFVLVPVLILRTASVARMPVSAQLVADGAAIGWALCLICAMGWALLKYREKRAEANARRRLGLDTLPERETEL